MKQKKGILPGSRRVSITVWPHHFDSKEIQREKAKWELHKNAGRCFESILDSNTSQNSSCTTTYYLSYKLS